MARNKNNVLPASPRGASDGSRKRERGYSLVVHFINTMTFVAPNLAWGKARGGRIPRSGSVTDEQRSPRPNSAQPFGRQFFFGRTSLLAPYRIHFGICASLAPRLAKKSLAANVIVFVLMNTKLAACRWTPKNW